MHSMRMKPWRWLVLLSALALVLAACAPEEDPDVVEEEPDDEVEEPEDTPEEEPVEGGTIVWAYEQEPGVLNSLINDGNLYATSQVVMTTLHPLYDITPDFEYVPSPLLEDAEVVSEDPFQVRFVLAEDATWSDGEPVKAADLFFLAQVQNDPEADIVSRSGWEDIDMEATEAEMDPDSKEFVLHFTQPYAAWQTLYATASGIPLPSHAFPEGPLGEDWNTTWADAIENPETGEPIANGPFIFESWDRGQQLEVVRNEDYFGEPAHLDRIVFRFIPDIDTMTQQLRGGEIDMMDPQAQLDLVQQVEAIDGVTMQSDAGPTWEHLDFQHENPLLTQQFMREAIARALDRDAFIEQFILPINPDAEALNSVMFVSNDPNYEDHFGEHVAYDPDRSRELLEENCEEGDDGIFVCDGERASFEWVTTAGNERRELFFEFAQQALQEVGIEVVANFGEPAVVFSADVLDAGNWDLFEFAWVGSPDPESNVELWRCEGDQNYHRHCPGDEINDLLVSTRQMLDPDERVAAFNEAGAMLAEDIPIFPLYQLPDILVHSDEFTGLQINTTQAGQVWNVAEWRRTG
jgi:peptide/nickel transport system substrate-binding protein